MATIYFQEEKTEEVLFFCDDCIIPSTGEDVSINGEWYKVKERTFYCTQHGHYQKDYSCTLWVEKSEQ